MNIVYVLVDSYYDFGDSLEELFVSWDRVKSLAASLAPTWLPAVRAHSAAGRRSCGDLQTRPQRKDARVDAAPMDYG